MSEQQGGAGAPTPIVGKIAILLFGVAIGVGGTLAALRLDPAGGPGTVATASVDLETMIGRGQSFPTGGAGSQPGQVPAMMRPGGVGIRFSSLLISSVMRAARNSS